MVLAVDAAETKIDELHSPSTKKLQQRFHELFGYETRSNHRQYLLRRIAWRLQALVEGDLSERALKRALEIAKLVRALASTTVTKVSPQLFN